MRKQQGVRFHRIRDFKQYYFNSIPTTSQSLIVVLFLLRGLARAEVAAVPWGGDNNNTNTNNKVDNPWGGTSNTTTTTTTTTNNNHK